LNKYDYIILRINDSLLPMTNVTQDRQTIAETFHVHCSSRFEM